MSPLEALTFLSRLADDGLKARDEFLRTKAVKTEALTILRTELGIAEGYRRFAAGDDRAVPLKIHPRHD